MTIKELPNYARVLFRNGYWGILTKLPADSSIFNIYKKPNNKASSDEWCNLSSWNNKTMESKFCTGEYSIEEVYEPAKFVKVLNVAERGKLLWERKEEEMLTIDGKEFSESTIKSALKQYVGE